MTKKQRLWNKLESIPELDNTQRYFLTLVAYGEGKYNPAAHNGTSSECAAAAKGVTPKLEARAHACGVPIANLKTGSWGTFQRLAPFWADDMIDIFGDDACLYFDPTAAPASLDLQIVDAIKLARALQGYQGFTAYPTVGNLRLGWASPGFMGYLTKHADRIAKYRTHAAAVKLPAGIIDENIARFPGNYMPIFERLKAGGL